MTERPNRANQWIAGVAVVAALLGGIVVATQLASDDSPADAETTNGSEQTTETTTPTVETTAAPASAGEIDADGSVLVVTPDPVNPIEFYASQWSTLEIWGDGWVEFAVEATGSAVATRDSEIGQLFSDEVHDAIDAAGATEVIAAYEAINAAGLVGEVLEVINEHPEARAAIFGGGGELTLRVRTTIDGVEWTPIDVPFRSSESLLATWSGGSSIAMLFRNSGGVSGYTIATSEDLTTWEIVEIAASDTRSSTVAIEPLNGGWFVATSGETDEELQTWIVSADGQVAQQTAPFASFCCNNIDSTQAGLIAGSTGPDNNEIWFTADGLSWEPRENPAGEWIVGVAGVKGGVVLTTSGDGGTGTNHWRGEPDGTGFVPVSLPVEVTGAAWINGNHSVGIAQLVEPAGIGRGSAIKAPVPHVTEFDYDSRHFVFDYDGFDLEVRVTNLTTGAEAFSAGRLNESGHSNFGRFNDEYLLSGDNGYSTAIPVEVFETADAAGRQAAGEALGSLFVAYHEQRYVLVSFDGLSFHGIALETDEGRPWMERASLNGDRVLFRFDDKPTVVNLAP